MPLESSANCVVIAGKRDGRQRTLACVVLATTRADVNGIARRRLDVARRRSSPMDEAVAATGMEYGGITPIGLPTDWPVLVDGPWPGGVGGDRLGRAPLEAAPARAGAGRPARRRGRGRSRPVTRAGRHDRRRGGVPPARPGRAVPAEDAERVLAPRARWAWRSSRSCSAPRSRSPPASAATLAELREQMVTARAGGAHRRRGRRASPSSRPARCRPRSTSTASRTRNAGTSG